MLKTNCKQQLIREASYTWARIGHVWLLVSSRREVRSTIPRWGNFICKPQSNYWTETVYILVLFIYLFLVEKQVQDLTDGFNQQCIVYDNVPRSLKMITVTKYTDYVETAFGQVCTMKNKPSGAPHSGDMSSSFWHTEMSLPLLSLLRAGGGDSQRVTDTVPQTSHIHLFKTPRLRELEEDGNMMHTIYSPTHFLQTGWRQFLLPPRAWGDAESALGVQAKPSSGKDSEQGPKGRKT